MLLSTLSPDDHSDRLSTVSNAWVSGAHIRSWANTDVVNAWRAPLVGKRVGIRLGDDHALARTLLALDGFASALILLPNELATDSMVAIQQNAKLDCLIAETTENNLVVCDNLVPCPPLISQVAPSDNPHETAVGDTSTQWILTTSGTTRQPRLVAHSVASLSRTVKKGSGRSAKQVWALLYDLNRFAGLQVFLQAIIGGDALYIPNERNPIDRLVQELIAAKCSAISATPTLWRKILMSKEARHIPIRQITLGGEIADQPILNALGHMFPNSNIRHIYASTEAGVGFSVSDGCEGFPLEYLQNGFRGTRMRVSVDGILELQPQTSDQSYVGSSQPLFEEDGFINTGDRVRVTENRVYFQGRDSGAINVGGNKVQPESIERVLLAHPAVAMAKVTGKKNPITGALVHASVTLKDESGEKADASGLRAWCAERLARHEVPAIISIVDELKIESSGKLSRRQDSNPSA